MLLKTITKAQVWNSFHEQPKGRFAVSSLRQSAERDPAALTRRSAVLLRANEILRSFNTWAFKREQPSDVGLLLQSIGHAIATNAPVPFVLYWGKGPRDHAASPDSDCLDYISNLSSRICSVYERGATFRLILTDTHALLNGHCLDSVLRYYQEIEEVASRYEFEVCWLSSLVDFAQVEQTNLPCTIDPDVLKALSTSASHWYNGPKTFEEAAQDYYRLNEIEKRAVGRMFPHAIFVTFNGSKLRCLFPDSLPIFYMYSLRKGFSSKPWFVDSCADHKGGEGV